MRVVDTEIDIGDAQNPFARFAVMILPKKTQNLSGDVSLHSRVVTFVRDIRPF
jgi:hypothetical protein